MWAFPVIQKSDHSLLKFQTKNYIISYLWNFHLDIIGLQFLMTGKCKEDKKVSCDNEYHSNIYERNFEYVYHILYYVYIQYPTFAYNINYIPNPINYSLVKINEISNIEVRGLYCTTLYHWVKIINLTISWNLCRAFR